MRFTSWLRFIAETSVLAVGWSFFAKIQQHVNINTQKTTISLLTARLNKYLFT